MKPGIILLVEDNPDDEALTKLAFEDSKITNPVVVARDGAEALDYLFARGPYADRPAEDAPILILLDLNLPKVHGIEVLRQLRADPLTRLIPVVVLTSSHEQSDIRDCYALGVNAYINKPVEWEQFSQAVRILRMFWLVLNQPPPANGGA